MWFTWSKAKPSNTTSKKRLRLPGPPRGNPGKRAFFKTFLPEAVLWHFY
jgi:hypothetical protein